MTKLLSFLSSVAAFCKANPALAASTASALITLLTAFGLHVSVAQLAAIATAVNGFLAGLVHVSVTPVSPGKPPGVRG